MEDPVMIKIVVNMPVKKGLAEAFKQEAKELILKSAAEAGNIYYTLNESVENPGSFAIMECWKDQAAIEAHNATEHFTGILPKLSALCEAGLPVELYTEVEY